MYLVKEFLNWVTHIAAEAKKRDYLPALDPEAVAFAIVGTVTTSAAHWIEAADREPISSSSHAVRAIFERLLEQKRHA